VAAGEAMAVSVAVAMGAVVTRAVAATAVGAEVGTGVAVALPPPQAAATIAIVRIPVAQLPVVRFVKRSPRAAFDGIGSVRNPHGRSIAGVGHGARRLWG